MMPVWANLCILYGLVEFGNPTRDAQNGNEELAGNVYAPIAESCRQLKCKRMNQSLKFCDEVCSWQKANMRAAAQSARQLLSS
jgi:hypothetical protein